MWGEDQKKVFTSGIHIFQRVCWVIFYYCFMVLCIFHPFWMSTKRNQATQKNFQATQLRIEAHRLRTMDLDCSNYSNDTSYFSSIMYIYCWNKNKHKHLINPEHCFANKQTKKMLWQQQQITETELPKIFSEFIFLLWFFVIFVWSSTKINLVYFFTQNWRKKLPHFDTDLFLVFT